MPVHNRDIAEKLNRTADLLEIRGENPFRVRAYRNAARTIQSLSKSAAGLVEEGSDLTGYSGIGKDLAGKIAEIVRTGTFDVLEELNKQMPGEFDQLMRISGLGAKRIAKLHEELDISTVEQLKKAIDSGEIRQLEGFGAKTEANIREEINRLEQTESRRLKLSEAEEVTQPLMEHLKKARGVKEITVAGSFRRRKETVGDLDILVTCKKGSNVMDHFTDYEDVKKVVSRGKTRSTVILRSGFQVDVRVVPQVSYGAALLYFTGSREHNIAVRKIGVKKGLKLNEYGLFKADKRVAGRTESEVYDKVGMKYVQPELREDTGEVEAAQKGRLPDLIEPDQIKGDLHVHSKYTDGRGSIKEMAEAAREMGYSYVAITDHSQHLTVANGLNPKRLMQQMKEIDKVNESVKGITVLKGIEVDILEDGMLDLPDDVLAELDVRVCSVHYRFNLPKEKQTWRILKAMDNPHFNILAHPSGRLIHERPAYEVDMERILKAAKDKGCLVEVNSHPDRLDLNDVYCKMAAEMGVKVAISTDAHRVGHLEYMRFGVGQARRGWLQAADVANTRSLKDLKKLLKPQKRKGQ